MPLDGGVIIDAPLWLAGVLLLLVGVAAVWDIRSFTIPNMFPLLTIGLFLVSIPFGSYDFASFGWHLLSGLIAFVIGYIFFITRLMGGGDVKLFAAIALWLPLYGFMVFAVTVSLAGAGLAIVVLLGRWIKSLFRANKDADAVPLLQTRLPYGVAIFAGTLAVTLVGRI